jgi:hypothetical protein
MDDHLELAEECGPRIITPDTPLAVREEIHRRACYGDLRATLRKMKLERRALCLAAIDYQCRENRVLEQTMHATSTHIPYAKIPEILVAEIEAENGLDGWNPEIREDTLRCYPGLKLNIKFGMHGQQYVGR